MAQRNIDAGPAHSHVTTAPLIEHAEQVPGSELPASPTVEPDSRPGWEVCAFDNLTAVSDLLHLLEQEGVQEKELLVLGERSFVVRWRRPE